MKSFEEIRDYLPKYLSSNETRELFSELARFPENIDKRLYSVALRDANNLFQGDAIRDMPVMYLPDTRVKRVPCLLLSNTCDISAENSRPTAIRCAYVPIIRFAAYERIVRDSGYFSDSSSLQSHLKQIRQQHISHMFYLPEGDGMPYEGIALFDSPNNCSQQDFLPDEIADRRMFVLGQYGFYLFLTKLSIHFTRIRENVARG